jgi:hypothetical protein
MAHLISGRAAERNSYYIRDFPFDFIACAPARYTFYDTQELHPMSIAHDLPENLRDQVQFLIDSLILGDTKYRRVKREASVLL